jgi:hypothetical protein
VVVANGPLSVSGHSTPSSQTKPERGSYVSM